MKIGRQSKIIELINKRDVETQDELTELLLEAGYSVTQATVSRDIRELNLTKVAGNNGRQKYIVLKKQEVNLNEKYVRILRDGFLSMDNAENIVVMKTISGMAMAVAAALDALHIKSMVGCIAGDDTIMCAIKTSEDAVKVMEKVNKILKGKSTMDEELKNFEDSDL